MKSNQQWISRLGRWLAPPNPSFHYKRKWLKGLVVAAVQSGDKILDLGSGGRRLKHSDTLCKDQKASQGVGQIWSVDIGRDLDVDVIADAAAMPFREKSFDLIISTAVLEHVANLTATVEEIDRCCRTGGMIYIEVPFLQTYHAHPHDYRRFTLMGLRAIFKSWQEIDSGVCVGPFSTLAWYLRKMPRFILGENLIGLAVEAICGWLTFWIKYFDLLVPTARRVHQAASGIYYSGEKK